MRAILKRLLFTFFALYGFSPFLHAADTVPVTIVYSAGSKGYFLPYKIYESPVFKNLDFKVGDRYGGYAAIAHYINKTRREVEAKNGVFLLVDGGNSLVGSSEANFFKGRFSVDFMNRMGYQAITVSNLDWSMGVGVVKEMAENATFALLNANIFRKGAGAPPPYIKPYVIVKSRGLKIGIIGYAQHDLAAWLDPATVEGLEAKPPIPLVRKYVGEMRDRGVDLIVAIDHTAGDDYLRVAELAGGIDVLIDGAAGWDGIYVGDFTLPRPIQIKNTYVFPESDSDFALGRIDLDYDRGKRQIVATHFDRYFMNLKEVEEDPEIKKIVNKYADMYFEVVGKKLQEVIGYATDDLTLSWDDKWNTPLGTLVCEAMRRYAKTDVGIENLGALRRHIKKGPIMLRDVQDALPFKNNLVTFTIKGRDLYRFNLLHSRHESVPPIPWIYLAGAEIARNPELGIERITFAGREIENNRDYTFAANDYLYNTGYLNDPLFKSVKVWNVKIADIVADFIRENSPISPSLRETGTHYEHY